MPIEAGEISSSMPQVAQESIMTKREIIKTKEALVQKALRRVKIAVKSLKETITIAERRVTWRKPVGQIKSW